ncbi:hypothetical protein BDD43_0399 [Mucilaginibacter gracilis]|uniref:Uncharacterized protein n=1 Tax=Mucilaginibacter gracilis TaxID=423350 RepID=A0A495IUR3_9SPHI|nr:hypothetical protein [Mucilaginibacter gracilis]RKR80302.1 hypothetical protein BDD43_0399 [Mucilaginibacter gracilis]
MDKFVLFVCLLFLTNKLFAQTSADSGKVSPLKTISYTQFKAYIDGVDLSNMAAVAELNGYPDPQKTLNLKKELMLNAGQVKEVTTINNELKRKMKEMGEYILKNEHALDELFRTKKVDDGSLIFYTNRFGLYQGEMRNAILQAYIKVLAVLSTGQQSKYQQLQKIER